MVAVVAQCSVVEVSSVAVKRILAVEEDEEGNKDYNGGYGGGAKTWRKY